MNTEEGFCIREKMIDLLQKIKSRYQDKNSEKINVHQQTHFLVHVQQITGK